MFGVALCLLAYLAGRWVQQKTRLAVMNALLVAIVLIIGFLSLTGIPLADFMQGGSIIGFFLTPATCCLALSIYRSRQLIRANALAIFAGCLAGSATAFASVYGMCRLLGVDGELLRSLLPKSVTTPIAMELSVLLGGVEQITVAAVLVSGIIGAVLGPLLLRLLRISDPVASGLAMGAASHGIGTARAMEMSQEAGACSSLAIGICGLMTVVIALVASVWL